ncbi:hypothetical protein FB451DRAFT_1456977 [Mycena latifolia]|nr:hypothetical protein FB451DRAFT_1456977 [Mycena latifolia]
MPSTLDISLAPDEAFSLLRELNELQRVLEVSQRDGPAPSLPGLAEFQRQLQHNLNCQPGPHCLTPTDTSADPDVQRQLPLEREGGVIREVKAAAQELTSDPRGRADFGPLLSLRPSSSPSPPPLAFPSFLPPSLAQLTSPAKDSSVAEAASESSVLGKRNVTMRPEPNAADEAPPKKALSRIRWFLPLLGPLSQAVAAGEYGPIVDWDAMSSSSSQLSEAEEEETEVEEGSLFSSSSESETQPITVPAKGKGKGKEPDRRNATSVRIGTDADIGYVRGRTRSAAVSGTGNQIVTNNSWRTDGPGPPVTRAAGVLLTQLLAIFSNEHSASLQGLISYLQNPITQGFQGISQATEMRALISDLGLLEKYAHANDLLYMCKLIQLALNVDQLRKDWIKAGNSRPLGIAAIGEQYGEAGRTFQHWHAWGSHLLHLCCAGTMYLLLPIATLGLRMTLTHESKESVRDINSLAEALREVSEGKWRPLVRRLITAIHYLQGTSIPALQDYKFVRGLDEFTFTDVEKADKILQSVQTNLCKLPARAIDWDINASSPWNPLSTVRKDPAEVVVIQTALKLKRSSALPFKPANAEAWTERERELAEEAERVNSVADLETKIADLYASGESRPGEYVDFDSDIAGGKTLVIKDTTGMEVVTLMTMPDDMIERFNVALDQLDAIFPGEFSYEDSRRKGYNYSSFAFTWYYRMGEKGHGTPADVHPNKLHKGKGRKVNHHQCIPCCSFETVDKAMEFEALNQIFAEAFEYQRINFRHANPEAYEQVRGFADNLPLNTVSPSYPFAGYMVNFRVATDAHKDTKDGDWCLIIFVKRGEGGEICLHELGLKINGKTGGMTEIVLSSTY